MTPTSLYCVIDEAHHGTAKTYRRIINYVKERVPNLKLLGLTATSFRTAKEEEGLLAKIFKDGVDGNGNVVKNDLGITYQIGLKELINAGILSRPIFEPYYTDEDYGKNLGLDALEHIQHLDVLPDDIATEIAESSARNKLIVNTYVKKKKEYGQTIVFAVNINHAIALNQLFKNAGVASDFIVSDIRDMVTGVTISREENEAKLQAYRDGDLEVLINVNILTEGVDLPQTKTVFLARPTVSKILMTQMVGRALRGTAAGGTAEAYIVSFVDKWNENIAWCNPDTIFGGDGKFTDNDVEYQKRQISMIAISKIEEFASLLDDTIDTTKLEKVPFIQRVPIGMYAFTYLEEDGMDLSYQVMVYDSTKTAYEQLMEGLPELFASYGIEDEYLSDELLSELEKQCSDTYFCGEMIPPYESRDILYDVTTWARIIIERDMSITKQQNFLNDIWEYEIEYLFPFHKFNKKQFLLDVMHEINYWKNKDVYDNEIEAVNCDLEAIGSECQYTEENEYDDLRSYFMELRLRMIFLDNQDFVRMKLRTLLRDHGYKRRTSKLNAYLKMCMYFYHIETYIRGGEHCDVEEIGLDDMINFRVLGNVRDMISNFSIEV